MAKGLCHYSKGDSVPNEIVHAYGESGGEIPLEFTHDVDVLHTEVGTNIIYPRTPIAENSEIEDIIQTKGKTVHDRIIIQGNVKTNSFPVSNPLDRAPSSINGR